MCKSLQLGLHCVQLGYKRLRFIVRGRRMVTQHKRAANLLQPLPHSGIDVAKPTPGKGRFLG
jgi:hypothetical protein